MEQPEAWRMTDLVTHELGQGDPFAAAMRATRMPMIITDPRRPDNPIVFANDAFLALTGYDRDEIVDHNCRFLQGEETDRQAVGRVRDAIEQGRDVTVDLLNYRKDGTSFWNALYISPVVASNGELQYFFASQLDVTERRDALQAKTALLHEVDHRVKNNLQMISALMTMQAKTINDPEVRHSLSAIMQRIEALSTVHRRLYQSDDVTRFSIAEFAQDIAIELVGATGRDDIALDLDLHPVTVPAETAAPLALMVNELVTNILKHAFPNGRSGRIALAVKPEGERANIVIADDGVGAPVEPATAGGSFGQTLVRTLSRQLRAVVTWSAVQPSGTRVLIDLPLELLKPGT